MTKNMKKYNVVIPPGAPTYPETDENWFQFPYILLSVAKKNSGKTASLSQFLHIQHKMDRLDRFILVSPTYHTNAHYFKGLPMDAADVLEPSISTADRIMEIVIEEARLFDTYHEDMIEWKRLQAELKSSKHIDEIDENLLLQFQAMQKPTYKFMRNGKPYKPILTVFYDDCQGTDAFSPSKKNKLSYMSIKHRHVGAIEHGDGKAIGINIMIAVQNYTTATQGLPKTIRGNCNILSLFKNKNEHELKLIAEEVSGEVDKETFYKVFEEATSVPYGFLTIDLNPKKSVKSIFRRSWNEYLFV
jgi:hypothetical protein